MNDELVTRKQMISTCLSTAAVAVVFGWILARPDVLALKLEIRELARAVHELKVQQTQNVTLGWDLNRSVVDLKKLAMQEKSNAVSARGMRWDQGGTGKRQPDAGGAGFGDGSDGPREAGTSGRAGQFVDYQGGP